jgi:hypothetical protein
MKSLSAEYSLSVGALLGSTPAEAEVDAEMEIEIPQQVVVIETPPEQQMPPPKRRRAPKKVLQAVTESQ